MVTETVVLDKLDDSWRSITNTGSYMILAGMTGKIRLRYGINSTSEGILLNEEDVVTVDETVYVQPTPSKGNRVHYTTLYVSKA